jgi:hypothetical protein
VGNIESVVGDPRWVFMHVFIRIRCFLPILIYVIGPFSASPHRIVTTASNSLSPDPCVHTYAVSDLISLLV